MIIKRIKIENFLSIKSFEMEFTGEEILSIIGRNFSGKTTLLEAIDYAITGNTRTDREVEAIHYGMDKMMVVLTLDDNGKEHIIKRGRDIKNNGLLQFNHQSKTKEAQQAIYDLIGVDDKEFKMTAFFNMSNAFMFMEMSSNDKKKHMMKWLRNDHWNKLKDAVDSDLYRLQKDTDSLNGQLIGIESSIRKPNLSKDEYKLLITDMNFAVNKLEKTNSQYSTILDRVNDYKYKVDKHTFRVKEYKENIVKLEVDINEIKQESIKSQNIFDEFDKLKEELGLTKKETAQRKKQHYEKELIDSKVRLKGKEKEFRMLNNNEYSGICPVLNEPCDRIALDMSTIKKVRDDIKALKQDIENKNEIIDKYENQINKFRRLDALQNKLKFLEKSKELLHRYRNELDLNKKRRNNAITTISTFNDKLKVYLDKKDKAIKIINKLENKISSYKEEISLYNNIKKLNKELVEKKELVTNKIVKNTEDLKYTSYLSKAFGKSGIPSLEIENSFTEIEDEINLCLSHIDDSLRIIFSSSKELTKKEDTCECGFIYPKGYSKKTCEDCGSERQMAKKDELTIQVLDNGNKIKFNQLSGGGKTIVSLAVRIALMRLLHRRYSCRLNTLFFDEIDAFLDDEHINDIKSFVKNVLVEKFKYTQIFWITHNDMLKGSATKTIKVNKVNSVSEFSEL